MTQNSPVHSTLRKSDDLEGRAVSMSGKYCISCLGLSLDGVGKADILDRLNVRIAFEVASILVSGLEYEHPALVQTVCPKDRRVWMCM